MRFYKDGALLPPLLAILPTVAICQGGTASAAELRPYKIALVAVAAGDWLTTKMILDKGGRELNPVLPQSSGKLLLVKAAATTGVILGSEALAKGGHKNLAKIFLGSAIGAWGFAATHNFRELRK